MSRPEERGAEQTHGTAPGGCAQDPPSLAGSPGSLPRGAAERGAAADLPQFLKTQSGAGSSPLNLQISILRRSFCRPGSLQLCLLETKTPPTIIIIIF